MAILNIHKTYFIRPQNEDVTITHSANTSAWEIREIWRHQCQQSATNYKDVVYVQAYTDLYIVAVGTTSLSCGYPAASLDITFETNGTLTGVSCSQSWITISKISESNGRFVYRLSILQNSAHAVRTANIVCTAQGTQGTRQLTYLLTQAALPAPDSLGLSTTSLNCSSAAQQLAAITVTSSGMWNVSKPASATWITMNKTYGWSADTIIFTAQANTLGSNRSAVITFTCGTASVTLTITQYAGSISLSSSVVTFPNTGGTQSDTLTSSGGNWTLVSNQSWLRPSVSSGTATSTGIVYTCDPNPQNSAARSAVITATLNGSIVYTKTINQAAGVVNAGLSVQYTNINRSCVEQSFAFLIVSNNQKWTATSNVSWCTPYPSSWTGTGTITESSLSLLFAENKANTERTGVITISNGVQTVTVNIKQFEASNKLTFTMVYMYTSTWPSPNVFPKAGGVLTIKYTVGSESAGSIVFTTSSPHVTIMQGHGNVFAGQSKEIGFLIAENNTGVRRTIEISAYQSNMPENIKNAIPGGVLYQSAT